MSEGEGKWGYLAASTVVTGVIGYFLPKALDSILPWLSENPLSQYPIETVSIAVAASLIGFLAGSKFGKTRVEKPQKLTQVEIRDKREEENTSLDQNPLGLSTLALDTYKKMEPCDIKAFKQLCCVSIFGDDEKPSRPLVFDVNSHRLSSINLDHSSLERLNEIGAIKILDVDDREIVGTNGLKGKIKEIEEGVEANPGGLILRLAEGKDGFTPRPVTWGAGRYSPDGLFGVDFGVVEFTHAGKEIASKLNDFKEPRGLRDYIKESYADGIVKSKYNFSYLTEDGEIQRP